MPDTPATVTYVMGDYEYAPAATAWLNATDEPPVPFPPDLLYIGPSSYYQPIWKDVVPDDGSPIRLAGWVLE